MDLPKVVYFGADPICLPVLNYLREAGAAKCQLRAVVSQPDRRQGRGRQVQANAVAAWARGHGVALLQPEKPGPELAEWLRAESVTAALVMAYGHFIPKSVRTAAGKGMYNFHASLLPKYRGASPIETALAMGEEGTGVCLMEVVKEMDAGAVADCERVVIESDALGRDLRRTVGAATVPLLARNLEPMLAGELNLKPQNAQAATYCRKIDKADGAIDFTLSAQAQWNRVRAFTPWPGTYFDHGAVRIKAGRVEAERGSAEHAAKPGTVLSVGECLRVAMGVGILVFHELQRPGGKLLPVPEFLRGYSIAIGDHLAGAPARPLLRPLE